jgi:pimeloyl-ACP methyl ester carboxylesterase
MCGRIITLVVLAVRSEETCQDDRPMGWRPMASLRPKTLRGRIVARALLYGFVLLAVLPWSFSSLLLETRRQPTDPPPSGVLETRLGSGGLRLRAWILEGDGSRPAVVIAHGLGDSLESFLDTGYLLQRRGHAVLLLDLRGHGASEGKYTTLGGLERDDVRAAMALLRRGGRAERGFVLFGVSMGAVAALRAAADRDDVRAVVAEAPYDTYRDNAAHHAQLYFHLPRWLPLIPLSVTIAGWRAGFDPGEIDAVAAARRVRAPLLAIVDGADPRMPLAVVQRVFDAHPGPKRLWIAPDAAHAGATGTAGYWREVLAFLESAGA